MKRRIISFLLACMLFLSAGCVPLEFTLGHHIAVSSGGNQLTEEELRLIALQYKTENESYYKPLLGIDFWQMKVADEMTYEEYIREYYVFSECRAVLLLLKVAAEQGITLTGLENDQAETAANAFFDALTEDERAFTGAGKQDVLELFRAYMIAGKTVEKLIEGKKLEVSDEESRVVDMDIIRLDTQRKAEELYNRIKSGESFRTLANEYSLDDKIEFTASREELLPMVADIVFSMSNGDISDIISSNGSYFIIYLENSYDMLLSLNHKRNLLAERRFEGWEALYEEYLAESDLKRDNRMFDQLSLSLDGDFPYVDMFQYMQMP